MTPSRYLKTLFWLLFGTVLSVGAFNWAVDPYLLFHSPEIDGFNQHKTELYKHTRSSLAHNLWSQKPENLLTGSSRSYFGFDTSASLADGNSYFNFSLPAANFYEITRYLQHAESRQPTRRLLIGLDMFTFNRYQTASETFSESRLAVNNDGHTTADLHIVLLREKFQALFTYDALSTSIRTVAKQRLAGKYGLTGFEGEAVNLVRDVHKHGQRRAFHRVVSEYPQKWCPPPSHIFDSGDSTASDTPMSHYRQLLRHAHEKQIELHLFITPSHAYLWEAMDRAGLWNTFEDWKRSLVRINEEEALRTGSAPYPLWDFSGYNLYTTESVPEHNSSQIMHWYWEASHFRPTLGAKVLSRIFDKEDEMDPDFGVLIDQNNIERHIENIRSARDHYRLTHEGDMREIDTLGLEPSLCQHATDMHRK